MGVEVGAGVGERVSLQCKLVHVPAVPPLGSHQREYIDMIVLYSLVSWRNVRSFVCDFRSSPMLTMYTT